MTELSGDVERVVVYVDGEKIVDRMCKVKEMRVMVEEKATRQVRRR